MVKYDQIIVQLSGENGNIFNLIGIVSRELRRNNVSNEELDEFRDDITSSKSYDEALSKIQEYVHVE